MYIKAAADTELEEFSKKVDCDRKILIATICEIKYITDWKSESVRNIIRVNNDFALFCSNYAWKKNTLFSQWNAGHIDHLFDSAHNSAGRIYPNPQRIFLLCYVTHGTLQVFAIFLLLLL